MSCESAHAPPALQPSSLFFLFFFLSVCVCVFSFIFNVTQFLSPSPACRQPAAAPPTPAELRGGRAGEERARQRAARGAAPRGAAWEGWFSRQSRAAAAAASAGAETGFSWCSSRAPSFMTARSGESPTPCEVSGRRRGSGSVLEGAGEEAL